MKMFAICDVNKMRDETGLVIEWHFYNDYHEA